MGKFTVLIFNILNFIFYLKGRENVHLLIYSPNVCSMWDWARIGARNQKFNSVLLRGWRELNSLSYPHCGLGAALAERWSWEREMEIEPRHSNMASRHFKHKTVPTLRKELIM